MGRVVRTWAAFAAVVWLLAAPSAGQYRADQVGMLGDVDRIRIDGNETFPADQILGALRGSDEYARAAHPTASRRAFEQALARLVRDGYLRAGFGRIRVNAEVVDDPPRLEIRIAEGPRFLAGKIAVTGLPADLEAKVRDRVDRAMKAAAQQGSLAGPWKEGAPAPFDLATRRVVLQAILDCLDRAGYFSSQAKVRIAPDRDGKTATLSVEVTELGPRTRIDSIDFVGQVRPGTRRVLPAFLGLKPGMAIDRNQIEDLERRLRATGRFLYTRVSVRNAAGKGQEPARTSLTIHLIESDRSPDLNLNPDADEKALLALARWCNAIHTSDLDVVASVELRHWKPGVRVRLVWSPTHGIIARLRINQSPGGEPRLIVVALTDTETILTSNLRGESHGIEATPLPNFIPYVRVTADPRAVERPFNVRAAFGMSGDARFQGSFAARVRMHPAAILALHGSRRRVEDGMLVLEKDSMRGRLDLASGTPIEFVFDLAQQNASARLHTERGAFARELAETRSEVTFLTPDYREPGDWFPAMVEFLLGHVLIPLHTQDKGNHELTAPAASAVAKIIQGMLPAYRRVAERWRVGRSRESSFVIPLSRRPDQTPKPDREAIIPLSLSTIEAIAAFFPRGTWPSTVARETLRIGAGYSNDGWREELTRIHTDRRVGPVGCLALAAYFGAAHASMGKKFAQEGLRRLGTEDFRRDYELFFGLSDRGAMLGRLVPAMLRSLRDLDDEEAGALAELIGPLTGRLLRECRAAVRSAGPDANLGTTMRPALDRTWETWLRGQVKAGLEALSR